MSYDLRIWSSGQMMESSPLLTEGGYKKSYDAFVRSGDGWQVVISQSFSMDTEDIPDSIMQALPGISFMTEINIEPIGAPVKVKMEILKLCNALAKEMKGVVEDPQEGTAKTPAGVKKFYDSNSKDKNRLMVSLIWNFEDTAFYQSNKIDQLINVIEKYLPDALPRRYGEFEPPQYKYAETGKAHLINFLKNESGPVWYGTKPFTYMYFFVPNIEEEKAFIIEHNLLRKSNPETVYGRALRGKYRCGHIELELLQDIFIQQDWNLAVKRLFVEIAKVLKPFHAEILCNKQEGLVRSWWWRGIPRNLGYAIILDERYTKKWKRFKKEASCISDNLYMVDCFGTPAAASIKHIVGAVPINIVAPLVGKAAFFPFQSALSRKRF